MFAVCVSPGVKRDVGRHLFQQHRFAPRRQTTSRPLHSPRSLRPSVRLLFSDCHASRRAAGRNLLLDGGHVRRHRAAALPADSHHDAAPLVKKSRTLCTHDAVRQERQGLFTGGIPPPPPPPLPPPPLLHIITLGQ
ncbi:unnamed protein product [Pleuronectes platessa]|uniref:Uncharacterized protein n=1 Tax=Pleuronectes platessa TaxID=8262 RepID=A0A9N7URZ3_PLEPL|nr:unnamed protein product [Pleuronectes platessa]